MHFANLGVNVKAKMDDLLQTIVPLQARVTDPVEARDLFTATALMVRHMNEPDQRSLILRAIERSGIIFGYPTWERKYRERGGNVNSSSIDDADFCTAQSNALNGSSEDLDRQAAMAVVPAQQKLSVQSNVYGKPSADTRQMVENPDARFADFGQAETLKFAEKHAVKAYEKEQTKQANKRKREQNTLNNIDTHGIANLLSHRFVGAPLYEEGSQSAIQPW